MRIPLYLQGVALLLAAALPAAGDANALLSSTLESLRDSETVSMAGTPLLSGRLLSDFYAQRGDEPVWTDQARITALLRLIEETPTEGFSTRDFNIDLVRQAAQPGGLDERAGAARLALDIQLSDALLRYVHHTRFGKLDPIAVNRKWNDRAPVPAELLIADMNGALDAARLDVFLSSRMQRPFWYQDLVSALRRLAGPEDLRDRPQVPPGPVLKEGSRGPRVAALRERLIPTLESGSAQPADPELFDPGLLAAVKAFQAKAGLTPDGVVGPGTLAAINSPGDRQGLTQVRMNLERMRWLFNDLPSDYIFVDVTDYMAHLIRDGKIAWSTRVIVGSEKDQTPMFRDSMEHVVLNPTWSVPVSIQKKMGGLSSRYSLVDRRTGRKVRGGNAADYKRYRIEQAPGPTNALGRVKFIFPNRHAVYLHDTPSRGLFANSSRALSHGCVRVQNPVKLAELLLGESGWDRTKIDRVISTNKTRYVHLDEKLPVLIYYLTARANAQGVVEHRRDIYERDGALRKAFESADAGRVRIAFPEPLPIAAPEANPAAAPAIEAKPETPEKGPTPAIPDGMSKSGVRLTQVDSREP